eukprot:g2567.t1
MAGTGAVKKMGLLWLWVMLSWYVKVVNSQSSVSLTDDNSYVCPDDLVDVDAAHKCICAKEAEHDAYFNYAEFYYCTMKERDLGALGFIALVSAVCFSFYLVGTTTDDYLVPTLERLSTFLNLSPPVAGVTLLALGNGAPDVFTSFAAFTGSSDISLGVGEVIGAGLVITTLVMYTCVKAAGEFETNRLVLRDIFFTLVAVLAVFACFIDGKVYLFEGLCLFGLWLFFVILVYLYRNDETFNLPRSMVDATIEKRRRSIMDSPFLQEATTHPARRTLSHPYAMHRAIQLRRLDRNSPNGGNRVSPQPQPHRTRSQGSEPNLNISPKSLNAQLMPPEIPVEIPSTGYAPIEEDEQPSHPWLKFLRQAIGAVLLVLEAPFTVARLLTIPMFLAPDLELKSDNGNDDHQSEQEVNDLMKENKTCLCFSVGLGPVLFALVLGASFEIVVAIFCVGSVTSVLLFRTISQMEDLQTPGMHHYTKLQQGIFLMVAFSTSILWVYLLSTELVDALSVIGEVMGISSGLLGLTFLAWGNCVQDLIADCMIAARGQPLMAIGAVYGGPGFNIMIGLGMGFTYATWPNKVLTFSFQPTVPISFIFFLLVLALSMVWLWWNKFRMTYRFGRALLLFYLVFLLLAILAELDKMAPWKIQMTR